jgi:hypothetical protein
MIMSVTAEEVLAAMAPKFEEYERRLADLREAERLAGLEKETK